MNARILAAVCLALLAGTLTRAEGETREGLVAEAERGNAQAQLRLGTMYDLGVDGPRAVARALRWYLRAAEAGLPEAQFNLAVMLDSGTGMERAPQAAALWYARAAASGHVRAQYNLGLLYSEGDGVPRNTGLARAWFGAAAEELPAARERHSALPPEDAFGMAVPTRLAMHRTGGGVRTFTWTAAESPDGVRFVVELRSQDGGASRLPVAARETVVSALAWPGAPEASAWRVVQLDPASGERRASSWRSLNPSPGDSFVILRPREDDAEAARLAATLKSVLDAAGHVTIIDPGPVPGGESMVLLGEGADAGLGEAISRFLPGQGTVRVRRTDGAAEEVGIVVPLIGGAGP